MTRVVLWSLLAIFASTLAVGCFEWMKGRSRHLVMAAVPNLAMAAGALFGERHPVWRYASWTVIAVSLTYAFATLRGKIRWRSPIVLSAGVAILLIVVTELVTDVFSVAPRRVVLVLVGGVVAAFAALIGSIAWEAKTLFSRKK